MWYAPKDINFSREQVENFILPNLYTLRLGEWPPEEVETGYGGEIDSAAIQHRVAREAYFTVACGIAGEIGARLARCGRYRQIIYRLNCETGGNPNKLASQFNLHIEDFEILWGELLYYISGWRRKRVSFSRWRDMRKKEKARRCY